MKLSWINLTVLLFSLSAPIYADTLIFYDNFDTGLDTNRWTTGAAYDHIDAVTVTDGKVTTTENYNYVESNIEFVGNIRVEMEIGRLGDGTSEHSCWEYYVELVANGSSGALRFYESTDGISVSNTGVGVCATQLVTPSLAEPGGKITLTYNNSEVQFSYENLNGDIYTSDIVYAAPYNSTKLRIWLAAHQDTPRYIDNVKVYSLDQIAAEQCDILVADLDSKLSEVTTQFNAANNIIDDLNKELDTADNSILNLNSEITSLQNLNGQLSGQLYTATEGYSNCTAQLQAATTSLATIESQVRQVNDLNQELETENTRISAELTQANKIITDMEHALLEKDQLIAELQAQLSSPQFKQTANSKEAHAKTKNKSHKPVYKEHHHDKHGDTVENKYEKHKHD